MGAANDLRKQITANSFHADAAVRRLRNELNDYDSRLQAANTAGQGQQSSLHQEESQARRSMTQLNDERLALQRQHQQSMDSLANVPKHSSQEHRRQIERMTKLEMEHTAYQQAASTSQTAERGRVVALDLQPASVQAFDENRSNLANEQQNRFMHLATEVRVCLRDQAQPCCRRILLGDRPPHECQGWR